MYLQEPNALDDIEMLLIEVHQVKSLKMSGSHDDLRKFQDFFEYIFVQQGFRLFYSHANWGGPPDRKLPHEEPAIEPKIMSAAARPPPLDM